MNSSTSSESKSASASVVFFLRTFAEVFASSSTPAFRFEAAVDALSDTADSAKSKASPSAVWVIEDAEPYLAITALSSGTLIRALVDAAGALEDEASELVAIEIEFDGRRWCWT